MILSKATTYGIRALAYLAKQPKSQWCGLREIADAEQIPPLYLGKLMNELRRHRLVQSTKGIHGGYALARAAEDINILTVFRVLDANPNFDECILGCDPCHDPTSCPVKESWRNLRKELETLLEQHTIAQLSASWCDRNTHPADKLACNL